MERLTTLHEMIIAEKDKQIAILQQTIKDMELKHEAERQEDIKNIKILKELLK